MSRREDTAATVGGCLGLLFLIGINIGWLLFVVWAVYTVVTWLITQ